MLRRSSPPASRAAKAAKRRQHGPRSGSRGGAGAAADHRDPRARRSADPGRRLRHSTARRRLLHGGRFDRGSWRPQAEGSSGRGFRVVAIDFRASVEARAGRETSCGYDAVCLAKDVAATLAYLRRTGATSIALVGASLGGGAAAQAAIDAPPGTIVRVVLLRPHDGAIAERLKTPALFIVARDDANASGPRLPGIRAQYEAATGPKELMVLDGAAHAQFLFDTPQSDAVMQAIVRFIESASGAVTVHRESRQRSRPAAPRSTGRCWR